MKSVKRTVTSGILAVALISGGGAAANAVITNTAFDGIMNRGQQARYMQDQVKEREGTASNIEFTSIGGTYLANVKAENSRSGVQYTERKGLGRNVIYNIENKTSKGHKTRLVVTNSKWTTVTVSIRGWYRTN